jgi:hypothetical protein
MMAMELKGVKMSKAFWQGFWQGFSKASAIAITLGIVFVCGLALGSYSHPYEKCKRMFNTQENIEECIWLVQQR